MPEKIFTGAYEMTYVEWRTPEGSLVGIPGKSYNLDEYPDDGRWQDPVPAPAASGKRQQAAPPAEDQGTASAS